MAAYKELFDFCSAAWRDDWEASRALSDKARTYVIVIGLVFGYSVFNMPAFLAFVDTNVPETGLTLARLFFTIYLVAFGVALVFTILSLRVRTFQTPPIPDELEDFRDGGPSDAELGRAYYFFSCALTEAIKANGSATNLQARWLRRAAPLLIVGSVSLIGLALWISVMKIFL